MSYNERVHSSNRIEEPVAIHALLFFLTFERSLPMESHRYEDFPEPVYTKEQKAEYLKRQQQRRALALTKTTDMKYTEALRHVRKEDAKSQE